MGFSLQGFIDSLLATLDNKDWTVEQKYETLETLIREDAKYAAECGHITLIEGGSS